jgi:hypothetical protein
MLLGTTHRNLCPSSNTIIMSDAKDIILDEIEAAREDDEKNRQGPIDEYSGLNADDADFMRGYGAADQKRITRKVSYTEISGTNIEVLSVLTYILENRMTADSFLSWACCTF